MAKTYILEPTEVEFNSDIPDLIAGLENTPLHELTFDEFKNLIPDGSIVDINNGDKFITASDKDGVVATRNGSYPEAQPEEYAVFNFHGDLGFPASLSIHSNTTTEPGTYTVSIYTETEDDAPKYSTNNFDFSDHPRNDMAGIDDLLDDILGLKESEDEETKSESDEEEDHTPR